ncbi:hypothetical protein [Cellulomonas sp.]|uniref:hypothetical protein n=1 Tax=Cellulomonas sp. TaxID=40001 RepID=UPI001B0E0684|nr:hypothetical protein [Cellulomonas sp.]MBO9553609.1 hypothetical protein [Cellulomonas sp.]
MLGDGRPAWDAHPTGIEASLLTKFFRSREFRWHAFCLAVLSIPIGVGLHVNPDRARPYAWGVLGMLALSVTLMRIGAYDQRRRHAWIRATYPATPFATTVTMNKESAILLGLPSKEVALVLAVTDTGLDLSGWPSRRLVVRLPWTGLAEISGGMGSIGSTLTQELYLQLRGGRRLTFYSFDTGFDLASFSFTGSRRIADAIRLVRPADLPWPALRTRPVAQR